MRCCVVRNDFSGVNGKRNDFVWSDIVTHMEAIITTFMQRSSSSCEDMNSQNENMKTTRRFAIRSSAMDSSKIAV